MIKTTYFSSKAILNAIRERFPEASVDIQDMTGEHSMTNEIIAKIPSWRHDDVRIYGFTTASGGVPSNDDVDVEMVVVRSGSSDDRGDIQTENEDFLLFGFRVKKLMKELGFTVVPSMEDYF